MFAGRVAVIGVWFILLASLTVGLNTGAQADTAAETQIEFNGTHLIHGENATDIREVNSSAQQEPPRLRELNERLEERTEWLPQLLSEQQLQQMTGNIMVGTFAVMAPVMDWSATFAYRHGSPAVLSVLRLLMTIAALAPLAVVARSAFREVAG